MHPIAKRLAWLSATCGRAIFLLARLSCFLPYLSSARSVRRQHGGAMQGLSMRTRFCERFRYAFTAIAFGLILAVTASGETVAQNFTEFGVPTAASQPFGMTLGPDGALWFTEFAGNKIGRITTAGAVTDFNIPTANSQPFSITQGPDGALWFTEVAGNNIGRITTGGTIKEFAVPLVNGGAPNPGGIALGSDGALWFTEITGNVIGRITTAGVITTFSYSDGEQCEPSHHGGSGRSTMVRRGRRQ